MTGLSGLGPPWSARGWLFAMPGVGTQRACAWQRGLEEWLASPFLGEVTQGQRMQQAGPPGQCTRPERKDYTGGFRQRPRQGSVGLGQGWGAGQGAEQGLVRGRGLLPGPAPIPPASRWFWAQDRLRMGGGREGPP